MVHVTYEDATTYAAWAGKTLPGEAATYVWREEFLPGGKVMANS